LTFHPAETPYLENEKRGEKMSNTQTFAASASGNNDRKLSIKSVSISAGLFLAVTYLICVAFDLIFPTYAMNAAWSPFLPGFVWISWFSFALGLIETLAYGLYVGIVFVPIYNFVTR